MSIFIPYSPGEVIQHFTTLFSLNLTDLTSYQTLIVTLLANVYFFCSLVYYSLFCFKKIINRIWERFF